MPSKAGGRHARTWPAANIAGAGYGGVPIGGSASAPTAAPMIGNLKKVNGMTTYPSKAILPNENDILLALIGRDVIRRKVTILGEFIPAAEWFKMTQREIFEMLKTTCTLVSSKPRGVYLDVRSAWAWFRGDPKTGALEVSFDKETWEPYPWPTLG